MSPALLSIRRPVFITCVVVLMIALGLVSMQKMGVDLFPDVTFPVVVVSTAYPGAGPAEIETLITKPIEEELGTLSGLKRITSTSQEGVSTVVCEFTSQTDVKYAEQQVRDRTGGVKSKLPTEAKDAVIRRIDPSDQPVVILSVQTDLPTGQAYDLVDDYIKPRLEQVDRVGQVDIIGGRKREVHVLLDRQKLKAREISVSGVSDRLHETGQDIPAGKLDVGKKETVFRALGQFNTLDDIKSQIVSFVNSDVPVTVSQVGTVEDGLAEEVTRGFANGKKALFLNVYRQSGANTISVVDAVIKRVAKINEELKNQNKGATINVQRDGAAAIRANVDDVKESILLGIGLAVVVVYLFLGSGRSTIITGLALPNSLIGSFVLMSAAGFTINIMSLLALSLAVGLLVDDAIVVRENIFRHIEMGKSPKRAALEGTLEVTLAVIAVTLAVLAVFGPVGFLQGVVGQFFKQFGLTICFAMIISLFDALTIAPMLSAYFAGKNHGIRRTGIYGHTIGAVLVGFDKLQTGMENLYERILRFTVRNPIVVLGAAVGIFALCMWTVVFIPKTFLPADDNGEFNVSLELPPGTTLDEMNKVADQVDVIIRKNKEIEICALTVGTVNGDSNQASFYIKLVPYKDRTQNTTQVKDTLRNQIKDFAYANPQVVPFDPVGAGQRQFNLNIVGYDRDQLEEYAKKVYEVAKKNTNLREADWNFRSGKPEFQAVLDKRMADRLGISSTILGTEIRDQIEGATPAVFRQNGREYDIRVRLQENQRNLEDQFYKTYVPNINHNLVRLSDVAKPVQTTGPSKIYRQDRGRYIQISADVADGKGLGNAMTDMQNAIVNDIKLPPGMTYQFVGQAENFTELVDGIIIALGLGILFIFLVLSSLYESFVTPFTIMLALPLAICGAFVALAVTHQSLNIFSMIGIVMLLGIASKNSILLVDFATKLLKEGLSRDEAIIRAGRTRLRPILMTTMALIAGTIPIAIGLNEASHQRVAMGVAIIGGLISSTLLTLIVVPAAFSFIDRFRAWSLSGMKNLVMEDGGKNLDSDPDWDISSRPGQELTSNVEDDGKLRTQHETTGKKDIRAL